MDIIRDCGTTAADWAAFVAAHPNYPLPARMTFLETDTGLAKVGNGVDGWENLDYTAQIGPQGPQGPTGGYANADTLIATSSDTETVQTGTLTLTIEAGKDYSPGMVVRVAKTSDPVNYSMSGMVVSYSGTTLVVEVTDVVGSGSHSGWTVTFASGIGSSAPQIDVFAIAGQSNAVGRAVSGTSPVPVDGTVYQYRDATVGYFADPAVGDYGSAWPSFGIEYYKQTGRVVGLIPAAVGGSGLTAASNPASNWSETGELFDAFITTVGDALAAFSAAGFEPIFRGVLWHQGESDADAIDGASIVKADYKTALAALAGRIQVHYENAPLYVYQIGVKSDGSSTTGWYEVRAAQIEVCNEDPANNLLVFQSAVTFYNTSMMGTFNHYNQLGYNEMGRISARAVIAPKVQYDDISLNNLTLRVDAFNNVGVGNYANETIPARLSVKGSTTSTGNLLQLEDSAGTLREIVLDSGKHGINTDDPRAMLHINKPDLSGNTASVGSALYGPSDVAVFSTVNSTVQQSMVVADNTGETGYVPTYRGVRARGTLASPAAAANGDGVFYLVGSVFDGTATLNSASVFMSVDGTVSTNTVPVKIAFRTRPTGAGLWTEALVMKPDGKIGIGNSAPTTQLEVTGTVTATAFAGDGSALTGTGQLPYAGIGAAAQAQIGYNNQRTSGGTATNTLPTPVDGKSLIFSNNSGVDITLSCAQNIRGGGAVGTSLVVPNNTAYLFYGAGTSEWHYVGYNDTGGVTDHGALTGLTDDDHTNYALLAGRTTPQTFAFGSAASATAGYLTSTSNAIKGSYALNAAGTIIVDELNTRLGVGITPSQQLHISNSGSSSTRGLLIDNAIDTSTANQAALLILRRARGNSTSPTAIGASDNIFAILAAGCSAAGSFTNKNVFATIATEAWSASGYTMGFCGKLQAAPKGAQPNSSTTVASNYDGFVWGGSTTLTDNVTTAICDISVGALGAVAGTLNWMVFVNDATNCQIHSGVFAFQAVANSSGTVTVEGTELSQASAMGSLVSGGTLNSSAITVAAGTGKITFSAVGDTSLTSVKMQCNWSVIMNGNGAASTGIVTVL